MITADRMAAVDRNATALGVTQRQLMESAGGAVAREVRGVADPGASVAVVAGRGNNGGDAFVAARFLDEFDVTVHLLGRARAIGTEAARANWDALVEAGYDVREVTDSADLDLGSPEVVVDGLLGTGISGAPREPERTAIEAIDATDATVVSVDVPSGMDADTGDAELAVDADRVVTFHDVKPGLEDRDGVTVADIGIPDAADRFVGPGDLLPIRRRSRPEADARVFVIGGGPYTGAPALSAQAALRAGASLAFVAVPESVSTPVQGYAEDLIVQPYAGDRLTPERVPDLVDTARSYDDVVVLGPGLGDAEETLEAAADFLEAFDGLAVVDADGLAVVPEAETEATLVCTPNAKELAALGGPEVETPADHADEVEALAADLGHAILAKGAVDVITDGETTRLCRTGDPGMAVGGTGDVLAGVVAAFLAAVDPLEAASAAPYANGRAGERLAETYGDGLLASDLLETIPVVVEEP